jgi:hypothetical protein
MYGDPDVMRRRATQLREQGAELRALADQLVARSQAPWWTGRAADAMRERVAERAGHIRDAAARHDTAADSLERHLVQVEDLQEAIATAERRAQALVADARTRVARLEAHDDGVRREPDPADRQLVEFAPPPPGHKEWLTTTLPGL